MDIGLLDYFAFNLLFVGFIISSRCFTFLFSNVSNIFSKSTLIDFNLFKSVVFNKFSIHTFLA